MSEEKPILVKIENGVCWMSLNRPNKLNSIDPGMLDMLAQELDNAEANAQVKCIVITGVGDRAFSAGADVSVLSKLSSVEAKAVISDKGHRTILRILHSAKPVIAAVNGLALGGGCELAIACDFRVASDRARFGQTEINLGLIPGWGATKLLPKILGPAKASEMMMTGVILNAEEALKIGLVNKVVPADKFEEEVKTLATSLAKGPSVALSEIKKLVNDDVISDVILETEAKSFGKIFTTKDLKEGFSAFFEKRKPIFKGS